MSCPEDATGSAQTTLHSRAYRWSSRRCLVRLTRLLKMLRYLPLCQEPQSVDSCMLTVVDRRCRWSRSVPKTVRTPAVAIIQIPLTAVRPSLLAFLITSIFATSSKTSFLVQFFSSIMPHATPEVTATPSLPQDRVATHLTENILTLQQTIRNIREDVANGIAPSILMPSGSVTENYENLDDARLTGRRRKM